MSNLPWKPWHEAVKLRDDLKTGELTLAMFAADLYEVIMGEAQADLRRRRRVFRANVPDRQHPNAGQGSLQRLAGKSDQSHPPA